MIPGKTLENNLRKIPEKAPEKLKLIFKIFLKKNSG